MSYNDELYPEYKTVMFGDVELPLSHKYRPYDREITAAEIDAHTKPVEPQKPRPAITAWEGAPMDAYWLDGDVWKHCQSGEPWVPSLIDVAAHICASIVAPGNEARRAEFYGAVAKALGEVAA